MCMWLKSPLASRLFSYNLCRRRKYENIVFKKHKKKSKLNLSVGSEYSVFSSWTKVFQFNRYEYNYLFFSQSVGVPYNSLFYCGVILSTIKNGDASLHLSIITQYRIEIFLIEISPWQDRIKDWPQPSSYTE